MAKKQTFDAKVKKSQQAGQGKAVKMIVSYQSAVNGQWKFSEQIVKVPLDADEGKSVNEAMKESVAYFTGDKS